MNRRIAVKAALGGLATVGLVGRRAYADDVAEKITESTASEMVSPVAANPSTDVRDKMLADAYSGLRPLMFVEQLSTRIDSRADLVISSALDTQGRQTSVILKTGTVGVFRADATKDEFTRLGGWYWRCGELSGKEKFESSGAQVLDMRQAGAGPLVMVIRQHDGLVHWCLLGLDLRC